MRLLVRFRRGSPFNSSFISWKYELPSGVFYKGVSISYKLTVGRENLEISRNLNVMQRLHAGVCVLFEIVLQAVSLQR